MVGSSIKVGDIRELGKKEIQFGLSLWFVSIVTGIVLALA